MGGKHPNRKKDKLNPYALSIESGEYYISFSDSQGTHQKVNIDAELYSLFDSFELEDISQLNVISRHYEHSELSDASLNQRVLVQPESLEELYDRKLEYASLHKALSALPEIQRRRIMMYYFQGYSYERIAQIEGCTKRAIKFSVDIALKKLKEYF